MIDLDAAEKLANAATQPGPWVSVVHDGNATAVDAHGMWVADCGAAPDDAAFIAAARQLVPALIAEVRQAWNAALRHVAARFGVQLDELVKS